MKVSVKKKSKEIEIGYLRLHIRAYQIIAEDEDSVTEYKVFHVMDEWDCKALESVMLRRLVQSR